MDMYYDDINEVKDGEIPTAYSQDDEFDGKINNILNFKIILINSLINIKIYL